MVTILVFVPPQTMTKINYTIQISVVPVGFLYDEFLRSGLSLRLAFKCSKHSFTNSRACTCHAFTISKLLKTKISWKIDWVCLPRDRKHAQTPHCISTVLALLISDKCSQNHRYN
ncbi:unnamed protein product [Clavelina lepadiformis]|uniref:Uncharacterized protein n=1 Tax=Clavelina lepadiformis TaxID=159417 RepID=A0ABP0FEA4_CLALP